MNEYKKIAQRLSEKINNRVEFDPEHFAYVVTDGETTLFAADVDASKEEIAEGIFLCDSRL